MRIPLKLGLIVGLALIGTETPTVAVQQSAQPQVLTKDEGPRAMRMLLTMQANRPYGKGNYGTLSEILELVPPVRVDATIVDEQTASYRGYTIRMTRSADRKHFELALVPAGGACAASWFSNEQNVIYAGQAIGCPAQ